MERERIIAIGLLTGRDLDRLGPAFSRAFPIDDASCFDGLLDAIDDADRNFRRDLEDTSLARDR
jgi:hypothetical protein